MAFDHSSNPAFNEKYFEQCAFGDNVMTINGTVKKTLILMLIMFCSATFTWKMTFEASSQLMTFLWIGLIGGFVASLITIFFRQISHITAPIYAIFEGLALGGISAIYELPRQVYVNGHYVTVPGSGITLAAMGITLGVMFLMLALYHFKVITLTEKMKSGIIMATGGIALGYLFNFVCSLFGLGSMASLSGITGIGIGVVIAAVAAFNFLLDFEQVERGVEMKAPQYMEWYCAFGLMLTLVWLYLEILKILSKMQKK